MNQDYRTENFNYTTLTNSSTQKNVSTSESHSIGKTDNVPPEILAFAFLLVLAFGIFAYRKYRATVRCQRIETLEKLWKLSPEDKVS